MQTIEKIDTKRFQEGYEDIILSNFDVFFNKNYTKPMKVLTEIANLHNEKDYKTYCNSASYDILVKSNEYTDLEKITVDTIVRIARIFDQYNYNPTCIRLKITKLKVIGILLIEYFEKLGVDLHKKRKREK